MRHTAPPDGAGINEPIRITFSEAMDASTLNATTIVLSGGVAATRSYDPATDTAILTPASDLTPSTQYVVTVTSGVHDAAGNAMAGNYLFAFTTGATRTSGSWTPMAGCLTWQPLMKAVWTGHVVLLYGGYTAGLRYDPNMNAWSDLSPSNMPSGREKHSAVWTGSEMIVWGGYDNGTAMILSSGGRYNPTNDHWATLPSTNAPSPRFGHVATWTGTEMIVWGGTDGIDPLNTGARFNPVTNTWTPIMPAPAPLEGVNHRVVWTGTEMLVWGGTAAIAAGGRYHPTTDTWTAMATANAPSPRNYHTAIWTGSEMIVWGGTDGAVDLDTGARYNPVGDSWTPTSSAGAASPRSQHTAVWTGSEMIVWGGSGLNSGGRYDPLLNTWGLPTALGDSPGGRNRHFAVWTGSQMLVWGGYTLDETAGRYGP